MKNIYSLSFTQEEKISWDLMRLAWFILIFLSKKFTVESLT